MKSAPFAAALAFACCALLPPAAGQPADPSAKSPGADSGVEAPVAPLSEKIAVLAIDALGMEAELVARLETLFRMELERLATTPLPTRREVDRVVQSRRSFRACAGEDKCLAEIGDKLGVDVVLYGSVAALGDSYVVNIKAVDSKTGKQLRRIATEPLRGSPDELIDEIRVTAYRLLAPEQLLGGVNVLTDMIGASIRIDGKEVGKSPLPGPITRLALGEHKLAVVADGYMPFEETITVRFQKATRVVVRLVVEGSEGGSTAITTGPARTVVRPAATPWYSSKWVYLGVGVAAGVLGGYVGYRLAHDEVIDCSAEPTACR